MSVLKIEECIEQVLREVGPKQMRGTIEACGKTIEFKYEEWTSDCIGYWAEKKGYELKDEDDYWWALWEAIDDAVRDDGWDGYVYVEPEDCGVAYGATVFYRIVR